MSHNTRNFLLFLLLAAGLGGLWWYADANNWLPKPEKKEQKELTEAEKADIEKKVKEDAKKREEEAKAKPEEAKKEPPAPPPAPPVVVATTELPTLIALGDASFYNRVLLSTRGGGLQQVVLPAFHAANRLGEEVSRDAQPLPLYLTPGIAQPHGLSLQDNPHYPTSAPVRPSTRTTQTRRPASGWSSRRTSCCTTRAPTTSTPTRS